MLVIRSLQQARQNRSDALSQQALLTQQSTRQVAAPAEGKVALYAV